MPWVLSGCWESSNLTNERISLKTHYGNSRTGNTSKRPKGKNCKADSAWNRRTPKWLPGVPQDRCWGPAAGAELHSGEAFALWFQAAAVGRKGLRGLRGRAVTHTLFRGAVDKGFCEKRGYLVTLFRGLWTDKRRKL